MRTQRPSRARSSATALIAGLCGAGLSLLATGISGAVSLPVVPSSSAPAVTIPSLTTPSAGVPLPGSATVSVPSLSTPSVSLPTTTQPSVSVPSTTTPTPPSVPPIATEAPAQSSPPSANDAAAGAAAGSAPAATRSTPHASPAGPTGIARRNGSTVQPSHTGGGTPGAPGRSTSAGGVPVGAAGGAATGVGATGGDPTSRRAVARQAPKRPSGNALDSIGRDIPLPLPVPDWSKPIILVLLLLAIWFGVRARLAARRARRLERQRITLMRDFDAMQSALVPELPSEVGGIRVSASYRAAEGPGAGGDFYDVFPLDGGRVAVILGDVVGHGHEALTDAALTRFTIRAYLQAGLDPRATLALASRVLTEPDTERYVTVVVGVFDSGAGELTYATAGHPTPIILGSREPPAISGCPALSCGLPTGRRQTRVSLAPGAEVCFFSDGLIEARVDDGLFGRERLRALLPSLGPKPLAGELLLAIRAQADSCPDDMSACIVLPQVASKVPSRYVEEFEADVRALAGGQAEHFLDACSVAPAAIAGALERASAIAVADGTAMLRVEIRAAGSAVGISGPDAGSGDAEEYRPASCAPAAMHPSSA